MEQAAAAHHPSAFILPPSNLPPFKHDHIAFVRHPQTKPPFVGQVPQDRGAEAAAAGELDVEVFEAGGVGVVSGVVADDGGAHFVAAGEAFVPGALELALSEEEAGEEGEAGEEHVRAAGGAADDGQDDGGEGDDPLEELLDDAELSALAQGEPKQKRRAGIGQRGDETAEQDHVSLYIVARSDSLEATRQSQNEMTRPALTSP